MGLFSARLFFITLSIMIFFFLFIQIPGCTCPPSQISLTLNYSVIGGGTGYSSPIITYTSNGARHTNVLGLQRTTYDLDLNTQWSIINSLSGSTPSERWQTIQSTTGTATQNKTMTLVYYHQFMVQFSYEILRGGSGFLHPKVSYTKFGSTIENVTVVSVWVDNGSGYSYVNPLTGSTQGERWSTINPSGIVTFSTQISPNFYNQYLMVFDYSINGGGNPGAPTVNYTSYGFRQIQLTAGRNQVTWADAQSSYSYSPNPLTGSNTLERWQASSVPSGTVSYPTTIRPAYYHQRILTLSYQIIGGGSPSPPSFRAAVFGSTSTMSLTSTPIGYWCDSGASWTEDSAIGSSSTERWGTGQPISGVISSATTILFNYYHQYYMTLNYTVRGGEEHSPPSVMVVSFGTAISMNSNLNVWVDTSSSYSYQNPLPDSNTSERWSTSNPNGDVKAPGTISVSYYHQFDVIFSFTVLFGSSPTPPSVNYVYFGKSSTREATSENESTWADANATYTYPQTLPGSSGSERWLITSSTNDKITGALRISPTYLHQYFVSIVPNQLLAGSASISSDWRNSTSLILLSPRVMEGWRFDGWAGIGEGSYTGPLSNVTLSVLAPINETMIFYPGLKINVNGNGYITYSLKSSNNTMDAFNITTAYLPIDTEVVLFENPNSFLFSFINWTGEVNSTSTSISLTIDKPFVEQANFGYNYIIIGLIVGIVAAVIAIAYFVTSRRVKKGNLKPDHAGPRQNKGLVS